MISVPPEDVLNPIEISSQEIRYTRGPLNSTITYYASAWEKQKKLNVRSLPRCDAYPLAERACSFFAHKITSTMSQSYASKLENWLITQPFRQMYQHLL